MKIASLAFITLLLSFTTASAQFRSNVNQSPRPQKRGGSSSDFKRFYFGGGGGLGFGTGYNYYAISPLVGYRLTEDFSVGTGLTYQRYNYTYNPQNYSYTQYGVTPFARYNFSPLFVQGELDFISAPTVDINTGEFLRKTYTRVLVGLGYMSQIGNGSAAFNILAMYDLAYKTNTSPFQSPIVLRVFVTF